MRAWLPERQVYGPEPAGERDTDALNRVFARSEEHTSELQSQSNLVCRLLLEKKNQSDEYRNPRDDLGTMRIGVRRAHLVGFQCGSSRHRDRELGVTLGDILGGAADCFDRFRD